IANGKLSVHYRAQVSERLWALYSEIEARLNELPLGPGRATLFAARLKSNLTGKLGVRLRVLHQSCQSAATARMSLGERWRNAVSLGRSITGKYAASQRSAFTAGLRSPFIFATVLPVAFLFPAQATSVNSYRECMSLSCNLMVLGSVLASLASAVRF